MSKKESRNIESLVLFMIIVAFVTLATAALLQTPPKVGVAVFLYVLGMYSLHELAYRARDERTDNDS